MAAATSDRDAMRKPGEIVAYAMPASATIYKGTLVSARVADGYAYPARSGTATDTFLGVSVEKKAGDGTAGSAKVRVWKVGSYVFVTSGMAQTDVGAAVYASDDQTVTKTATDNQLVGYIEEVLSATSVRVRIDRATQ
jgi:hypothetical protein